MRPVEQDEFMCVHGEEEHERCKEVLAKALGIVEKEFNAAFVEECPLNAMLLFLSSETGVSIISDQWSMVSANGSSHECDEIKHGLAALIVHMKQEEKTT